MNKHISSYALRIQLKIDVINTQPFVDDFLISYIYIYIYIFVDGFRNIILIKYDTNI